MERNTLIYQTRRKGQVLAHYLISDELLAKIYSLIVLKKKVDLKHPKTFNEKIQWLKINDYPNNKLVIQCADKYAVRDYVENKGLGKRLVPLFGAWENVKDIDWDHLPTQFVLKCNHGCAYNIICSDKSKMDKQVVFHQLNKWMKEDFGVYNVEPHYSKIAPHMITCEEFLGEVIIDYKFFCFNGEPKFMYVSSDLAHDRQAKIGFFDLNGNKIPFIRDDYDSMDLDELPSFFEDMKKDATELCQDFPFVRVDFFIANESYYFAELTFTPSAGMMPFNPDSFDYEWGNMLDITQLLERK